MTAKHSKKAKTKKASSVSSSPDNKTPVFVAPDFIKDPMQILGLEVMDEITGVTGIAVQVIDVLGGNVQIAVQPKSDNGGVTMPDAYQLDIHTLKAIGVGLSHKVVKVPHPTTILLGDEVRDVVTGVKGTATHKTTYLNGCEHILIVIHEKDRARLAETSYWTSAIRLKTTGTDKRGELNLPENDTTKFAPGGPPTRIRSTVARRA